mmetsp:Transcript_2098/g.8266  ORF Transcript_2098/g.8266 Transcript_2098/m.8266 type:complete len:237 (-) Transcript_2098:808-1518(-)
MVQASLYSFSFDFCVSGELLGKDQPINLKLIEVPQGLKPLKGVMMEIQDGAFPLLKSMVGTSDLSEGFGDADVCLLIGARPRGPGMERKDLMSANASIFKDQGKAINTSAKKTAKVLVVGNPANTNALVLSANAPNLDPKNIHAMTRLDQNRALGQMALKLGIGVSDIEKVWHNADQTTAGRHSRRTLYSRNTRVFFSDGLVVYLGQPFIDAVSGYNSRCGDDRWEESQIVGRDRQ